MALLQKLKDVRIVKQNYFVLQHRFYGELPKRFPYLMKKDIAPLINKIEKELHILLCAALKYKSIKIQLTAMGRWGGSNDKTHVNIQRTEPGFYYPQSQRGRSDIHYLCFSQFLTAQDDMYQHSIDEKGRPKKDHLLVALSELKKINPQIISEKIDIYFKFLREVMAYRPKFLCYTEEGYDNKASATFEVKELQFDLLSKSMDIQIKSKKDKKAYYNISNEVPFVYNQGKDDILHMLDYSEDDLTDFDKKVHDRLKMFINHYKEICTKLEHEEKKKCKAYKTCQSFLKQINVHTLPFKVLNAITEK